MDIIKCGICEKEFRPTNYRSKFCSPACKAEGHKRRNKRNNDARKNKDRVCVVCGTHFHVDKGSQKYCSEACHIKAREEKAQTKAYSRYDMEDPNKINVNPHGWLKYAIENGMVTQCPMCGEWTRSESGFCPKHENNH